MLISPVSFAKFGVSNLAKANSVSFGCAECQTSYKRPDREYSEYQTLWNNEVDDFTAVTSLERQIFEVARKAYLEQDPEKKAALEAKKEALVEQKLEAEMKHKESRDALWQYRAKNGVY